MIDNGANVNAQDANGTTPLMRAAYGGLTELVVYLLEHGANKEIMDFDGNKAVHYVRSENLGDLKGILK